MATVVKLHVFPESFNQHRTRFLKSGCFGPATNSPPRVLGFGHNREGLSLKQCRAFRSEDVGDSKDKKFINLRESEVITKMENGFWNSLKYILLGSKSNDVYRHAVVKMEEVLLSVIAIQMGRYIVTMVSTRVILAIGFQMSGGDSKMDALIRYSCARVAATLQTRSFICERPQFKIPPPWSRRSKRCCSFHCPGRDNRNIHGYRWELDTMFRGFNPFIQHWRL